MPATTAVPTANNRPATAPAARPAVAPYGLGFGLFVLLNATLFVRPSEMLTALETIPVFQIIIIACLLVSFPAVLALFSPEQLERRPITLCVLVLLPLVPLSNLVHLDVEVAIKSGQLFVKAVTYYLLFVALVSTTERLRTLMTCLVLFAAVMVALTILDFNGVIDIPKQTIDEMGREIKPDELGVKRMEGTGLFHDPNELCVMIGVSILLTLNELTDRRWGVARVLWLLPLALFGYGFVLTQSRGGLLGLTAGLGILFVLRYGLFRAVLLGGLMLPVVLALLGGRQADLSTQNETGQGRIQIWSDGLLMFRNSPVFGIGANKYQDEARYVAHNSYLHAFSELGFVGGILYVSMFYLAGWGIGRLRRPVPGPTRTSRPVFPVILDPELERMCPYVLGMVLVYIVGQQTLSLNYVIPTYVILGLAGAYLELARTRPALPPLRFDFLLLQRMVGISLLYLLGLVVFVRVFRD